MGFMDCLDARKAKQGSWEPQQEPELQLLLEQTLPIHTSSHELPSSSTVAGKSLKNEQINKQINK